jgi:hypothetical protein
MRLIWGDINLGAGDHVNEVASTRLIWGDINRGVGDRVNGCGEHAIDMG